MKKTLTILALSAATVASSFAQGYVSFGNTTTTRVSVNTAVGATTFTTLANTANLYYFALFYSTTEATVNGASGTVVGGAVNDTASAFVLGDTGWSFATGDIGGNITSSKGGVFASLVADSNGNTAVPVSSSGSGAQFVVVGWSANIGSTEASLVNFFASNDGGVTSGAVGESAVSPTIVPGPGGTNPSPGIFGSGGIGTGFDLGMTTISTPEPSTIALGVMGAASLLALRRKKA